MIVTELLAQFANPDAIHSLSTADKLTAGLITTLLGMGITFTALVVLQFIMSWMDRILNRKTTEQQVTVAPVESTPETLPQGKEDDPGQDDKELVAVITATLAMKLKTSVDNIVIKNIEKLEDRSPAWNRAGIIEQMNNRL